MINRSTAISKARDHVADKFVVVDTWAYMDEEQEQEAIDNTMIRLKGAIDGDIQEEIVLDPHQIEAVDTGGIFWVTLAFDSVQGDGNFNVTLRVTEEEVKVVDFVASLESQD